MRVRWDRVLPLAAVVVFWVLVWAVVTGRLHF